MKVTMVSASIRYSKSLEPGEYKTVELSAEASLEPEDDWFLAQQNLYASLTTQLRTLWGKNGVAEHAPDSPTMAIQQSQEERVPGGGSGTPPPQHFCQEHSTQFRKFERDGQVWWSHKAQDGQWCREKCP
jgi:hypothetical protein